jgi:hypothetical protein
VVDAVRSNDLVEDVESTRVDGFSELAECGLCGFFAHCSALRYFCNRRLQIWGEVATSVADNLLSIPNESMIGTVMSELLRRWSVSIPLGHRRTMSNFGALIMQNSYAF